MSELNLQLLLTDIINLQNLTIEKMKNLVKGLKGDTPQKGVDYWTENDINSITSKAIELIESTLFTNTLTNNIKNELEISLKEYIDTQLAKN